MKVRLADVAAYAGVSEASVSRVLNGKPGVSEAQRRTILTALDMLGYERPPRARAKKAGLIGLVVPELDNPVFPLFAQSIEMALARHGYTTVLCTQSNYGVHEDEYVRMLLERGVSGIVFVSGIHANMDIDPTRYVRLRDRGLPIVLINGYVPGVDAPFVSNDDATAVDLSVRHLAELGHRSIGLAMGPARYVPVSRRIAAFQAAIRTHVDPGVRPHDLEHLIACTVFSVDGGTAAAEVLIERGVTAVICGSDVMALGVIRAARQHGLRLPQDLSIVGSDDIPLVEFTEPSLTSVHQPVVEIAETAAKALLDEIAGQAAPRAEYMFRPTLVVRGSTTAPRAQAAVRPRSRISDHASAT